MVSPLDEEASHPEGSAGGAGSLEPSLTDGGFLSEAVSRNEEPVHQRGRANKRTAAAAEPGGANGAAVEPVPITFADPITSTGPTSSREMAQQQEEPAPNRISTLFRVCPFILGNEFCERLAFYGLSTNLVIYLTTVMGYNASNAAAQVTFFDGTCYLTPLLGAWLADSMWGRYKTILFFSYIYMLGLLMLVVTTVVPGFSPGPEEEHASLLQNALLFGALYTIALGTGGIKPNVSAFGADQFDESDPQDALDKKSFFNYFYFSINVGSFIAAVVIVYVQENISWAIGFLIPAIAMAIAVTFFQCGSRLYSHIKPAQSPLSRVVKVVSAAIKNRMRTQQDVTQVLQQRARAAAPRYNSPYSNEAPPVFAPVPQAAAEDAPPALLKRTGSFQWLDKAILEDMGQEDDPEGLRQGLLDNAIGKFTPKQVMEVKYVLRMLPVFFTTIFYWALYMQMGSLFVQQGAAMNRNVFDGKFLIPAASLSTFNTISIIALVPVYDKLFIPALRACGLQMTMLQRIGWGQVIAILAMLSAAWVEIVRLRLAAEGKLVEEGKDAVDMAVWYQTPQYILVGLSEVFASIGQLEFFYNQAPDVMRSCSMALQLLTSCLGSYSAGLLVWATQALTQNSDGTGGWLPRNINNGRLDLYFLLLAGVMAFNTMLYLVVAYNYEYKDVEHEYSAGARRQDAAGEQDEGSSAQGQQQQPRSQSIAIGGRPARGRQNNTSEGPYGRSITYVPAEPNFPPQLR